MKLKNVKVGVRVQLKKDHPFIAILKKGMKGIILEDDTQLCYTSWNNFTRGHDGNSSEQTRIKLGLPANSVHSVDIGFLKHIKE